MSTPIRGGVIKFWQAFPKEKKPEPKTLSAKTLSPKTVNPKALGKLENYFVGLPLKSEPNISKLVNFDDDLCQTLKIMIGSMEVWTNLTNINIPDVREKLAAFPLPPTSTNFKACN